MSEYAQSQGINITNQCYDCMQLDEMCNDCLELKEARDADIAHQIVDEGNMQYKHTWSRPDDQPSGHDWIASQTVRSETYDDDGERISVVVRYEFTQPIVVLQDGGVLDNLWELEDYTQRKRETECKWCHILTPKMFNDCQSCDKPLERNVC